MSYENDYPWGCKHLTIHFDGSGQRIMIDPNSPASVVEGLEKFAARTVTKIVGTPKENPMYEQWIVAVKDRETRMSFEEWENERRI